MKKIFIIGLLSILVLALGGGAGYYFLVVKPKMDAPATVPQATTDTSAQAPVSLTGKLFTVPDMQGATTTLDLLSPTTRRDYPMGRFTTPDGKVSGKLVAFDEFISTYANNRRAVPVAVDTGAGTTPYYLAILEGDDMRYATSVLIADRIRISSISREGDVVTLSYYVHDKGQAMEEIPTVGTSVIVNIVTGALLQAGRTPASEVSMTDIFESKYFWIATTYADGKVVKPETLDYYMMNIASDHLTLDTDCNSASGSFTAGTNAPAPFTVGTLTPTKKPCSGQYEGEYFTMFGKVATYSKEDAGKLTLHFTDGGTMDFVSAAGKEAFLHPVAATTTGTSSKKN
jgi:hypothetical protein